jgi:hypothetical protein
MGLLGGVGLHDGFSIRLAETPARLTRQPGAARH